jgi:acylphosphatase
MTAVKRLRIHGQVQGIGYRNSMLAQAVAIGVKGWVRNRRDGTVEAMVAGTSEAVQQITDWARHGPRGALVTEVRIETGEGSFGSFEQLPTA